VLFIISIYLFTIKKLSSLRCSLASQTDRSYGTSQRKNCFSSKFWYADIK